MTDQVPEFQYVEDLLLKALPRVCVDDSYRWFPGTTTDLVVHTLGLVGESGEFADIVKKSIRGSLPKIEIAPDNLTRAMLIEELTDVLIYIGNIAGILHIDLEKSLNVKREINEERFNSKEPSKLKIVTAMPKDVK